MRKMREVLDLLGLSSDAFLKHGNRRIVYGIPLAENFRELLIGIQDAASIPPGSERPLGPDRSLGTLLVSDDG